MVKACDRPRFDDRPRHILLAFEPIRRPEMKRILFVAIPELFADGPEL
jgi:hypothetical protein